MAREDAEADHWSGHFCNTFSTEVGQHSKVLGSSKEGSYMLSVEQCGHGMEA